MLLPRDLLDLDYGPKASFMQNLRYMAQVTDSIVIDPSKYNQTQLEEVENKFLEGVKVYTLDLPEMKFPQDRILTTPNIVFYHPDYFKDVEKIRGKGDRRRFIPDKILAEGGRYAIGDGIVFFGYGGRIYKSIFDEVGEEIVITDEQFKMVDEAFEGYAEVIRVPAPVNFPGFKRGKSATTGRVPEHIDQFTGSPIMYEPGFCISPIQRKYYEAAQNDYPVYSNDIRILYVPIDGDDYYYFNYPRDHDGRFYVEPILVEKVKEKIGIDLAELKDKVVVLPVNTPLFKEGAGLKCRVNFLQLKF